MSDVTITLTIRQLHTVAYGLAYAYADERTHRDQFTKAAAQPTSNPRRREIFIESSNSAARNMAEIAALAGTLPESARNAFTQELGWQATA